MQELERPVWLKKRINCTTDFSFTKSVVREFGLNTVCQSALCPNIFDCFSKRAATFLILGNICTRRCAFCFVGKGPPERQDANEPHKIAEAVFMLGLRRVVITSVTRDDLKDGGAGHFVMTVEAIRGRMGTEAQIEVLVPDFQGNKPDIIRAAASGADIFSHNVETVPRLYASIRPEADYKRSLDVLRFAKGFDKGLTTKSAIMLGLGEGLREVVGVMEDLRLAGCDIMAIGQYLRPSADQVQVRKFIEPGIFERLKKIGYELGFKNVYSGPFVRSSYKED